MGFAIGAEFESVTLGRVALQTLRVRKQTKLCVYAYRYQCRVNEAMKVSLTKIINTPRCRTTYPRGDIYRQLRPQISLNSC